MAVSTSFCASADLVATGNSKTCAGSGEAGRATSAGALVSASATLADCCGWAHTAAEKKTGSSRTADLRNKLFIFDKLRGPPRWRAIKAKDLGARQRYRSRRAERNWTNGQVCREVTRSAILATELFCS